jgi:hypothetical protein
MGSTTTVPEDRDRTAVGAGEGLGEGVIVPGEEEAEYRRRHDPRRDQRQRDTPESLEPCCTLYQSRLFELRGQVGEEGVHEPDREGQVEGKVGDDEPPYRVEQVQVTEDQVERHDNGRDRRHPGADDPEGQMLLAAEVRPSESVAPEATEYDGDHGGDAGSQEAVLRVAEQAARSREKVSVVLERGAEDYIRRW